MLAKLIRYDMKSLNRFLPVMHFFVLLSALLIRLFITGRIQPSLSGSQLDFLLIITFILCFTVIVALSTGTYLLAGIRFYKNIFTDEGYLTKTLPVTNGTHLLSKTIAGSIWAVINMFCMYLCAYIVIWTPYIKSLALSHKEDILTEFGFVGKYADIPFSAALAVLLLFSCFGAVSSIIMIYASVAVGQLFKSHRILGAVVSYFVISTLLSVLMLVAMTLFGHETRLLITAPSAESDFSFIAYMVEIMKITTGLILVSSTALYIITYYIINKKINLL